MLLPWVRMDSKGKMVFGQTLPRPGMVVRDCCDSGCFQIVSLCLASGQMTIVRIGDDGQPAGSERVVTIGPEWTLVQLNGACSHGILGCATEVTA